MEINVSRRFKKLVAGIDNFPEELKAIDGKLSLICIARTLARDGSRGKFCHEDGVYDFATLTPANNGYCFAEILDANGNRKKVKFSYSESGILVPEDKLSFYIDHPGSLRKPHPSVSTIKVLEAMVDQNVLINDDKPKDNNIYTIRKIQSCNGVGYNASFFNSQNQTVDAKYDYETLAGILVPKDKFPAKLMPPRTY